MKNSFCSKYFSSSSFLSFLCQSLNFLLRLPPSWSLTIWCPPLFAWLNWNHIVKTPNIYQQTFWRCEKAGSLRIMPITHIQPFLLQKIQLTSVCSGSSKAWLRFDEWNLYGCHLPRCQKQKRPHSHKTLQCAKILQWVSTRWILLDTRLTHHNSSQLRLTHNYWISG